MMIDDQLYKEYTDFWCAQTRPMTAIEAAYNFVEKNEYYLIDPVDLANYDE